MSTTWKMGENVNHPYYPRDLKIPIYVPNETPVIEILGIFFAVVAVALVGTWLYCGTKEHLRGRYVTKIKICWFVVCALIHCVLEGYFAVNHKTLAGGQSYLAQMWKEYGNGDSRYITSDPFTVCMESITAFVDGPLAALSAYAFFNNTPTRHVFQLLLSLCQLYGDVLYMVTEAMDGFTHGQIYHPLYFWFYFIFLNVLWLVIPSICIFESCSALTKSQAVFDNRSIKKKNS